MVVGFRDTSLTASEGETVRFAFHKVGLFDSDIKLLLSGEGLSMGVSYNGATRVINSFFSYTAPDNDVALEDDVTIIITFNLNTISPRIMMSNTALSIVVQDNDGEFITFL